jgi:hypothetical protein
MNNFEMPLKTNNILENDIALESLSKKMETKLAIYTPDPNDFREIYGDNEVNLDIKYANLLERKWEMERSEMNGPERKFFEREKQKAIIAEGIITNQLSGSWLNVEGSPYSVIAAPTSKPDDYGVINKSRKGFDLSLEFINNEESSPDIYAGSSIDVTTSENEKVVKSKISKIINLIKSGETPIIKYFENDAETFKGSIDVAPFVLVLSAATTKDLFEKEYRNKKEDLENHTVQLSLLNQLKEQAETFSILAMKYENETLVNSYEQSLKHIKYLLLKKKEFYDNLDINIDHVDEKYQGLKLLHKTIVENL